LETKEVNIARKIRLYPNTKQKEFFERCFRFSNKAWNICHSMKMESLEVLYIFRNKYNDYGKAVTASKDSIDKKADSKIKNYVVKAYNNAWSKYYNEYLPKNSYDSKKPWLGQPNFRSYRKSKFSYTSDKPKFDGNKIILPVIKAVKFRGEVLDEDIANFTVSEKNGKYYCSIIYKNVEMSSLPHTNEDLGMDWGETNFYTCSDNTKLNPVINFELEKKINTLTSKLSCKTGSKKGQRRSNNYNRLLHRINKLKEYRSNVLDDWEHKISLDLVKNYDDIYIEELNHKKLHFEKKHGVMAAKKLYYRAGMFLQKITYKLKWYKGNDLVEIDKNGTSKTCSKCGTYFKELPKNHSNEDTWTCTNCSTVHDGDINAAFNIRTKGRNKIGRESGTDLYNWNGCF
jgi:putative transposase